MKGAAARALCVLSVSAALAVGPAESRAALLYGELTGVTLYASQMGVPDGTPFPFGLTSENGLANAGVPVTVRFSLDTALLPPNQDEPGTGYFRFEDYAPATPWLSASIEVNGASASIDTRYLLFGENHDPGASGDGLFFGMGDATANTTLQVMVEAPSFAAGEPFWTDLEVSPSAGSQSQFQMLYGADSGFGLTFNATHLSLHAVPEPGALAWLAVLGLATLRHRRA